MTGTLSLTSPFFEEVGVEGAPVAVVLSFGQQVSGVDQISWLLVCLVGHGEASGAKWGGGGDNMKVEHVGHTCWWSRECPPLRGYRMGLSGLHGTFSSLAVTAKGQLCFSFLPSSVLGIPRTWRKSQMP